MSKIAVRELDPSSKRLKAVSHTTCWPALWPLVVAQATRRPGGRPSLSTAALEAALLLSHFEHQSLAPLRASHRFTTAPPHLAGFLTEALALAVTADMARAYGWSPSRAIVNFDDIVHDRAGFGALISKLAPTGPRPDLLFLTPAGLVAGESRGRSFARRPSGYASAAQDKRVEALDHWASVVQHGLGLSAPPLWFMAWLSFNEVDARVDFFDLGDFVQLPREDLGQLTNHNDRHFDAMFERSRAEQLTSVVIGGVQAIAVEQRVGEVSPGRVEWLHLLLSVEAWNVRDGVPASAGQGPPRDDPAIAEDVNVAVSRRLASVLTVTEPGQEASLEAAVGLVERRLAV